MKWRSVIFLYFYFQRLLSVLQIKAETEIREAERLISEKDAELNAAEDSLSGLKEVFNQSLVNFFMLVDLAHLLSNTRADGENVFDLAHLFLLG